MNQQALTNCTSYLKVLTSDFRLIASILKLPNDVTNIIFNYLTKTEFSNVVAITREHLLYRNPSIYLVDPSDPRRCLKAVKKYIIENYNGNHFFINDSYNVQLESEFNSLYRYEKSMLSQNIPKNTIQGNCNYYNEDAHDYEDQHNKVFPVKNSKRTKDQNFQSVKKNHSCKKDLFVKREKDNRLRTQNRKYSRESKHDETYSAFKQILTPLDVEIYNHVPYSVHFHKSQKKNYYDFYYGLFEDYEFDHRYYDNSYDDDSDNDNASTYSSWSLF